VLSIYHLRYTSILLNRFSDFDLKDEPESYAKHVIQNITTVKGARFLASRLGKFFKHLNSSNAIVLVGHKDVSEGVLLSKVIKPIFDSQFCVTISDELLQTQRLSVPEYLDTAAGQHVGSAKLQIFSQPL